MKVREWVNCPICGESDMSKTPDGDDGFIINCVNLACASNGGDNKSVVSADLLAIKRHMDLCRSLLKVPDDEVLAVRIEEIMAALVKRNEVLDRVKLVLVHSYSWIACDYCGEEYCEVCATQRRITDEALAAIAPLIGGDK